MRAGRPHELSAELERLLIDKAPAVANWGRLTDDTLAGLTTRVDGQTLTLLHTITMLGTPQDVTVQELRIEIAEPASQGSQTRRFGSRRSWQERWSPKS